MMMIWWGGDNSRCVIDEILVYLFSLYDVTVARPIVNLVPVCVMRCWCVWILLLYVWCPAAFLIICASLFFSFILFRLMYSLSDLWSDLSHYGYTYTILSPSTSARRGPARWSRAARRAAKKWKVERELPTKPYILYSTYIFLGVAG